MARRKNDADVGPLGVWAYNTRDALDLSVEAVVAALPTHYHPATIRKVEGGSAQPGTRMWRELGNLYAKLADERHVPVDPQPRLTPEPVEATETPDALVSALTRQIDAISELVTELREARQARETLEARLAAVEAELALRAQRAGGSPQAQSAPGGSAG